MDVILPIHYLIHCHSVLPQYLNHLTPIDRHYCLLPLNLRLLPPLAEVPNFPNHPYSYSLLHLQLQHFASSATTRYRLTILNPTHLRR
jgi:hypothetical protein